MKKIAFVFQFFHEWGNSFAAIDRRLYRHVLDKGSGYALDRLLSPPIKTVKVKN